MSNPHPSLFWRRFRGVKLLSDRTDLARARQAVLAPHKEEPAARALADVNAESGVSTPAVNMCVINLWTAGVWSVPNFGGASFAPTIEQILTSRMRGKLFCGCRLRSCWTHSAPLI